MSLIKSIHHFRLNQSLIDPVSMYLTRSMVQAFLG